MASSVAARRIGPILSRHPAVGLALGVRADGHWAFACRGYADLKTGSRITERTVFRIASVTKTMTAIAVMQLWERGLIELDAPATDFLRAYPLVTRKREFQQPTIRHLLTHTSGIPDARHLTDLMHVNWGPWDGRPPIFSVRYGAPLPPLAEHYRTGLE